MLEVVEHLIATERLKLRMSEFSLDHARVVVEHLIATERLKHFMKYSCGRFQKEW